MTTPAAAYSYPAMSYYNNTSSSMDAPAFAHRPSYEQQEKKPYTGHQQPPQQLVPHYGPGGPHNFDSYYHNYQIPSTSKPEYVNYASSTVAASHNTPSELFDGSYRSGNSSNHPVGPSLSRDSTDDLLVSFEATPTPSSLSVPPSISPSSNNAQNDAFISSFSKEDLAEQERLMKEIEQRKSIVVPKEANDMTVYEQQDRLWNSIHHQQHHDSTMVPHSSYPSTMTVYDQKSNDKKMIQVPRSRNPTGSDAVHPRRSEMKQARKVKTATAATGGAIFGGVLFGPAWPLGVVVGGAAGAVAGKQISKAGERRAQRKWEKENFQHYASSQSAVAKGGASFA
jgi:hypothetical protein